jgi:hypothetical protein
LESKKSFKMSSLSRQKSHSIFGDTFDQSCRRKNLFRLLGGKIGIFIER